MTTWRSPDGQPDPRPDESAAPVGSGGPDRAAPDGPPAEPARPPESPRRAGGGRHSRSAAPALAAAPAPPARPRNRKQLLVLGAAGALIVAAVVLLVVVLVGGSSNAPRPGSPAAVTDSLASALNSGSAAAVRAVSCPSARQHVLQALHGTLGRVASAVRSGPLRAQRQVAVSRLTLTVAGQDKTATVALGKSAGTWCVQLIAVS